MSSKVKDTLCDDVYSCGFCLGTLRGFIGENSTTILQSSLPGHETSQDDTTASLCGYNFAVATKEGKHK